MSRASSCSTFNNSWSNNADNDCGVLAKLRRLKIQEGLLLQNINKIMPKIYDNKEQFITISSDFKSSKSELNKYYCEIKNLFDSLKCATTSDEALKSCDIDDIKTDIMELDAKIRKFKNFLLSEQTSLKSEEQELTKYMSVSTEDPRKIIKRPKIRAKLFSDIVPSPVKNIIMCPFKYQEVQQFQDFLKSYHRHGGWNEYSHNIFVQFWIKHFHITVYSNREIDISVIESSNEFISEIIDKLPGVTKEDIIRHSEWYLEYLHLKSCQQEALNRWRAKKKVIKKSQFKDKEKKYTEKKNPNTINGKTSEQNIRHINSVVSDEMKRIEEMLSVELLDESSEIVDGKKIRLRDFGSTAIEDKPKRVDNNAQELFSLEKQRGRFHFAKSTKQWTNMCNDKKVSNDKLLSYYKHVLQLENIKKLCVPKWRLSVENK